MPRFDRVSYQKVFPLGMYINERLGVEMQLDEGDDANEALATAKAFVEEFHKENNKGLYLTVNTDALPDIQAPKEKLSPLDQTIADIESCKELKVLESYRLIVKNEPKLQTVYDNQYKKLTNG